ncbi:MAG: NfeD family protein [Clostridia bacterium]|nr:NfeD family protein [Clostridia bacterium]
MAWFWLALAIALMVIELSTTQLLSLWFSIGAGITAIVKVIFQDIGIVWQVVIFAVVSLVLLIVTRPLAKKLLSKSGEGNKTNLDLIIGKEAIVTEEIDNVKAQGAVKLNGLIWSARSRDESVIPVDTVVIVEEINGNKTVVSIKEKEG